MKRQLLANPRPLAFTTYSQRQINTLSNQVKIIPSVRTGTDWREFRAIWDTGASHTVITEHVVTECGLLPTGMVEVIGVHGSEIVETYKVDVLLPMQVQIKGLKVSRTKRLFGDADILVGMDIIGLGDFAVSSWQGRTTFSFRMPSTGRIDFLPPKGQTQTTI